MGFVSNWLSQIGCLKLVSQITFCIAKVNDKSSIFTSLIFMELEHPIVYNKLILFKNIYLINQFLLCN
jgi:hypothetical protein